MKNTPYKKNKEGGLFELRPCYVCQKQVLARNRGKKERICFDCAMTNLKKLSKISEDEREEIEKVMGYY